MTKTYSSLVHLNGNLLAAIDLETTGLKAGYHEPIQIAVVPLNSDLRPLEGVRPFYTTIRPNYPERQEKSVGYVHGLKMEDLILHSPDAGKVADLLVEWWEKLDLPVGKTLVPLAHNWAFECKFLQAWLGLDLSSMLFHGHARDAMLFALSMNDKAAFLGLPPPFPKVGLASICKRFNVVNPSPHDALCDAIAEAECYRAMLMMELL
jgi:DNA polymerase III epsilon subunit-like protein